MAYRCTLGETTILYIVSRGQHSEALLISEGPRRSQSMTSLETGAWSAPPRAFATTDGVKVYIRAEQGDFLVRVQGSSLAMTPVGAGQHESGEALSLEFVEAVPGEKTFLDGGDLRIHDMRVEMNAIPSTKEIKVDFDSPAQSN